LLLPKRRGVVKEKEGLVATVNEEERRRRSAIPSRRRRRRFFFSQSLARRRGGMHVPRSFLSGKMWLPAERNQAR
jgi:hypothetical protein